MIQGRLLITKQLLKRENETLPPAPYISSYFIYDIISDTGIGISKFMSFVIILLGVSKDVVIIESKKN